MMDFMRVRKSDSPGMMDCWLHRQGCSLGMIGCVALSEIGYVFKLSIFYSALRWSELIYDNNGGYILPPYSLLEWFSLVDFLCTRACDEFFPISQNCGRKPVHREIKGSS